MSFYELARSRYSVRKYRDLPVEESAIKTVITAAAIAPSASNKQPWVFIVIRDEQSRFSFRKVYQKEWLESAPVLIAACCDHERSWKRIDGKDYGEIDVAVSLDHLTLAAAELGLGTCWIGNFDVEVARKLLKLPDSVEPVALTPLGYPDDSTAPDKKRKTIDEIVFREWYGGKKGLR